MNLFTRICNRFRRHTQELTLLLRWYLFPNRIITNPLVVSNKEGLDCCDIVYINLEHRQDRRNQIETEFQTLGISQATRFDAIKDIPGALGCARSHLAVLSKWNSKEDRLLMVCEDDAQFLADRKTLDAFICEFQKNDKMDILCIGYRAKNGIKVNAKFILTSNTQTTSCYVIKPYMRNILLANFSSSVTRLKQGESEPTASIDQVWKELQSTYHFVVPSIRLLIQRESYSDILHEHVNYNS